MINEDTRFCENAYIAAQFKDAHKYSQSANQELALSLERRGHILPSVIHITDISEYPDWDWQRIYLVRTQRGWREILVPFKDQEQPLQKIETTGVYIAAASQVNKRKPVFRGLTRGRCADDAAIDTLYRYFIAVYYWGSYRLKQHQSLRFYTYLNNEFQLSGLLCTERSHAALFSRAKQDLDPTIVRLKSDPIEQEHLLIPMQSTPTGNGSLSYTLRTDKTKLLEWDLRTGKIKRGKRTTPPEHLLGTVQKLFLSPERPSYISDVKIVSPTPLAQT